jgi:hypothetical protein
MDKLLARHQHGMTNTPIYDVWANMKARCYNPKSTQYKRYGDRGIKICDEWVNNFEAFYEYMGQAPEGLTIDRINNDGNYEPGNVRWANRTAQCINRSKFNENRSTGHRNVYMFGARQSKKRYTVRFHRECKPIYLGYFSTLKEAIKARDLWLKENPYTPTGYKK